MRQLGRRIKVWTELSGREARRDNSTGVTAMAKMFYTMDEAKAALGKNEEEIKQYAREGRLREFRDGARLMFKVDQVESLKNELASGLDQVNLEAESGAPIGLIDTRGGSGSGSGISLVDTEGG